MKLKCSCGVEIDHGDVNVFTKTTEQWVAAFEATHEECREAYRLKAKAEAGMSLVAATDYSEVLNNIDVNIGEIFILLANHIRQS